MNGSTEHGKVVVFYSFKGGTGRTMALANIGCLLAQTPATAPVLLVDWDLEAPGLHRYFFRNMLGHGVRSQESYDRSPGLIEFFLELDAAVESRSTSETLESDEVIEIIRSIPLDDYIAATGIPGVSLLKAGIFDENYASKIAGFDWPRLYKRSPTMLREFVAHLATKFRFVLVDSRTGLSDTSGICTMLLPEVLVTVFTPNKQSITGVTELALRAGQYRGQSDDLRPLLIYPLPSRIEASEPELRFNWRFGDKAKSVDGYQVAFERLFTTLYGIKDCQLTRYFDDVQIQHVPIYGYGEEIAVLNEGTRDRLSLTRSYQRFALRLTSGIPPWSDHEVKDDALSIEAEDTNLGSKTLKDSVASSYIQYLRKTERDERRRGALFGLRMIILLATVAISLYFASLVFSDSDVFKSVTISMITATVAAAAAAVFGYLKAVAGYGQSQIENELRHFESGRPPYDRDDALELLRARMEPIIAQRFGYLRSRRKDGPVYISYRREDSALEAHRIFDVLRKNSNRSDIFLDISGSIRAGQDFTRAIEQMVGEAETVLVVIGGRWLDILRERRSAGELDFVALEIEHALRSGKRVIPVLLEGARIPAPDQLPPAIRPLASRQAIVISHRRWDASVFDLMRSLDDAS